MPGGRQACVLQFIRKYLCRCKGINPLRKTTKYQSSISSVSFPILKIYCKHKHFSDLTIIAIIDWKKNAIKVVAIFFITFYAIYKLTIIRNTANLMGETLKFQFLQYFYVYSMHVEKL